MYEAENIAEAMTLEAALGRLESLSAPFAKLFPRTVDKPLALYGAGELGRMAWDYFRFLGIQVDLVVDRNAETCRSQPFWSGTRVVTPDQVTPAERGSMLLALCVVTAPVEPLLTQLASEGWGDVVPFYDIAEAYRSHHPLSNGWFAPPLSPGDAIRIGDVLRRWADDRSRAHHLQFLAWRLRRQEWRFEAAPVTVGDRYFIPEVLAALGPDPAFLDVGAHHGQVSQKLIAQRPGVREIWMIEPDPVNLAHIEAWRASLVPDLAARIDLRSCAVSRAAGERSFFEGLGYASQFSAAGQCRIETSTIDQLGLAPSLVKMHLEGWELDALEGAAETLMTHRPIVTATVYHNEGGFWAIPLWLMDHLDDYDFLFRLHGWCGTGAVVYAIPKAVR